MTAYTSIGRILIPIGVAFQTLSGDLSVSSEQRIDGIMVEGRSIPGVLIVALRTVLRESGLLVVGIGGSVEIFEVTTDASIGRILIAIGVAFQTLSRDLSMSPEQWIDSIMVESRAFPGILAVALGTILRESCLLVVGICGCVEVFEVATHTSIGRILVTIGMTFQTLSGDLSMSP